jgi:glucosyl-3-phosphoglycerate synthase
MSDFFQNGEIATFHRLKHREVLELEAELQRDSKYRPISLVLHSLPESFGIDSLQAAWTRQAA